MKENTSCPLCETSCEGEQAAYAVIYDCPACGRFAYAPAPGSPPRRLSLVQKAAVSHFIRARWDVLRDSDHAEGSVVPITQRHLDWAIDEEICLPTRAEQAANAIKYIGSRVEKGGGSISIEHEPPTFAFSVGSPTASSAAELLRQMEEIGLVVLGNQHFGGFVAVDLTLLGWERYEELIHAVTSEPHGFFACDFGNDDIRNLLEDTLKPAFKQRGYDLSDMRGFARPGLIDNIMQERIRRASFVIVDLTDDNLGAYWEGGFAQALGKPVVYICEHEKFNHEDPRKRPHFDTNHYTTITWGGDKASDRFLEELIATLNRGGLDL